MNLEITNDGRRLIVKLEGELFDNETHSLKQSVLAHFHEEISCVIFDLSALDYMSAEGLGVIMTVEKRIVQNGGKLIIQGAHGTVKKLIEMVHFNKYL